MPDYPEQNFNQPTAYVPPPPSEVSVRTMESDVRTMALSGGNFPQAEKVSVTHSVKYNAMGQATDFKPKSSALVVLIWVFAILLFLGALGYFLYPFFTEDKEEVPIVDGNSTSTTGLPTVPDQDFIPEFSHRSFFTKGEKQVLDLRVNYPDDVVPNTESYTKDLIKVIGTQGKSETIFLEIELNKTDGKHLALTEFFDWAKFQLLEEKFWNDNFGPDFNYFVFKDKGSYWTGMVIRAKNGKSPILLKKDLLKIEQSKDLEKFFFATPGTRGENFTDFLLAGQSVRRLEFSRTASVFVYGWYNGNFIITTSEKSFIEAAGRL